MYCVQLILLNIKATASSIYLEIHFNFFIEPFNKIYRLTLT